MSIGLCAIFIEGEKKKQCIFGLQIIAECSNVKRFYAKCVKVGRFASAFSLFTLTPIISLSQQL